MIVLHGSIGDVTRALPLVSLLRGGFREARIIWSVEPVSLPLVKGYPGVDDIIVFERQHGWQAFFPFLARIRAERFDLVLDLQRHFKSGIISWWSGAPQRIGFHRADCKELNWLFNNRHIGRYDDDIPKLDHYLKFAEFLGVASAPVEWHFPIGAEEHAAVDRHLAQVSAGFAALFVGTRWPSKQWFPSQMARCVELLRAEYQLGAVLLGSAAERELAADVVAETQTPVVDLVGRTSLREAVGIIQRAAVAIGPDTGLMHIAAAVKTPVISLWGATSPNRTGPYGFKDFTIQGEAPCVPCYRRRCSIGRICLRSITTGQIADKVATALSRAKTTNCNHG
ncbi:MAG TPA: glycosyltransferase family 9 protein [Terriglobales bacterium]|nr:glycosyltransferase family 9 protein [Terriglobales bacterium]